MRGLPVSAQGSLLYRRRSPHTLKNAAVANRIARSTAAADTYPPLRVTASASSAASTPEAQHPQQDSAFRDLRGPGCAARPVLLPPAFTFSTPQPQNAPSPCPSTLASGFDPGRASCQTPASSSSSAAASAPRWSRRAALMALPLVSLAGPDGWGLAALPAGASAGRPLRSLGWRVPCELTVLNDLDRPLKIYWLNYDGDPESFGSLSPGSIFTVNTFESHAWRFVDSASGATLAEHVAGAGQQLVRVAPKAAAAAAAAAAGGADGVASYTYTAAPPSAAAAAQQQPLRGGGSGGASEGAPPPAAPRGAPGEDGVEELVAAARERERATGPAATVAERQFEGFDGLGNDETAYVLAQLREISIYPGGGTVHLVLPSAPLSAPLEVALAGPEALSLVAATGSLDQRRPSTLGTWTRSLLAAGVELRRVCITRMVDGIYYCRLVLSRPDSSLASLDATPGDSLSLALQLGRPIYVSNEVARVHQSVFDIFARRRQAMEEAAAAGRLDEAAEAEADRQAQEALDAITRGLPSAPRPVRELELDRGLNA